MPAIWQINLILFLELGQKKTYLLMCGVIFTSDINLLELQYVKWRHRVLLETKSNFIN